MTLSSQVRSKLIYRKKQLVGGRMVITQHSFRGGRLVRLHRVPTIKGHRLVEYRTRSTPNLFRPKTVGSGMAGNGRSHAAMAILRSLKKSRR